MKHPFAFKAATLGLVAGTPFAEQPTAAPPPRQNVRGDVVTVAGDTVKVKSRGGEELSLKLAPNTAVAMAEKGDTSLLAKGAFVGTAAVQQRDGTLRALEVHVFPESMRGTGAGHRPWDLRPGSTATDATVSKVDPSSAGAPPSSMTNATVGDVGEGGGGRKLVLRYPEGEKTVVVPAGTPVVKLAPADRSQLVPGAHLFAVASRQPDGSLVADRVMVGKDGVVPPM
jgi:hypothetical protein